MQEKFWWLFSHLFKNFCLSSQFTQFLTFYTYFRARPLRHNNLHLYTSTFLSNLHNFFYISTYFVAPGLSHTTGPRGSIPLWPPSHRPWYHPRI